MLRNYCNKLAALTKNIKYPIAVRNFIKSNSLRFRSAITKAVEFRNSLENQTSLQKIIGKNEIVNLYLFVLILRFIQIIFIFCLNTGLKKDITNSYCHIFGQHEKCNVYFCKGPKAEEKNLLLEANSDLILELNQIVNRLANNAESLLLNVTNNICEQFNSIVNKHICGKRINFSQRQSYNVRVEAAVLAHNTSGKYIRAIHKNLVNDISPGKIYF